MNSDAAIAAWERTHTSVPSLTIPQRRKLGDIVGRLGEAQGKYAIRRYARETVYPNVNDFEDWLRGEELPEELICAAFLTEEPAIVKLGEELEVLLASWFPDGHTKSEILDLRLRLAGVLR